MYAPNIATSHAPAENQCFWDLLVLNDKGVHIYSEEVYIISKW